MKRILHISTRLILGGSQENTVLSCEAQATAGHEVHLAFGPIYGPEGSLLERVQRFRTPDGRSIQTHVAPDLVREISPLRDWRAYIQLRDLIERLRPDVVHTHSSKAGILGRAAAWEAGGRDGRVRVVHTIHGPPFMPVEGSAAARLKTRLLNGAYMVAERFAANRCHAIVSVADAMTREFLKRGVGEAGQYATVRSGMEVDAFLRPREGEMREEVRRALGLEQGDFVLGTVARLAQHKGHDDLLEALGEVLRERRTWRLLWVGDGWWRERLVAKARAMGLGVRALDGGGEDDPDAKVVLTGLVPPERVPAMMRAMDVLAHPSYREGLPRTVPQALLCGVPVIAYDVDGTGEACRDGETGLLVRAGDVAGLRGAAEWMWDHGEGRRAMAQRGQAICREAFSVEAMAAGLERVYRGQR